MRKTPQNRNIECTSSALAAERLADYKGEGHCFGKEHFFHVVQCTN